MPKYDIKKQKDKEPFKSSLHKLDINEKQYTGTDDVHMQEEHFIMNSEVPTVSTSPITSCISPTRDVIMSPPPFPTSSPTPDLSLEINNQNKICKGYSPVLVGDVYSNFPYQLLCEMQFLVFENGVIHSTECQAKGYTIFNSENSCGDVNICCYNLQFSKSVADISEKANKPWSREIQTLNNKYLTHIQLVNKVTDIQVEKRDMRLKLMKTVYKNSKLRTTLNMHQRFLASLSENNVARLRQLVAVALRNNRSINYITTKVLDAIDGCYSPRPSQCDKDLAVLVLKLGGPSLLDILYRARVLPTVSIAYKMAKQNKPIMSAIDIPPKVSFDNNIVIPEDNTKTLSLKMDETYVKPNISYSPCDNKVYGICYQYGSHHKLELYTFDNCLELQSKIQKGILHVPKECKSELLGWILLINLNLF